MSIDRSEVNRALAKAIAYKGCGKDADAAQWARQLVQLLECAEILAAVPDRQCPADWGNATPSQRCTLEAGHARAHSDEKAHSF